MRAEGRVAPLAVAQLVLGREGKAGQIGRRADVLTNAAKPVRVEAAGRLEVGELLLQRAHARGGSSPSAAASSAACTVRPYASIATRRSSSGVFSSFVCETGGEDEEKTITVGISRAISAASWRGPLGIAVSLPPASTTARRARSMSRSSNGIGGDEQKLLNSNSPPRSSAARSQAS